MIQLIESVVENQTPKFPEIKHLDEEIISLCRDGTDKSLISLMIVLPGYKIDCFPMQRKQPNRNTNVRSQISYSKQTTFTNMVT